MDAPLCPCHGVPMRSQKAVFWRCVVKTREASKRYHSTAKGRAAHHRASDRSNPRRVRTWERHFYTAATVEEARAMNAHIKERLSVFITRFSTGAQVEGPTSNPVPPETNL